MNLYRRRAILMVDKLLEKIRNNCNNVDIDMVEKAYHFAESAHKEQKRESGEPYIIHQIAVAEILAELGMDTNTIVAGLLHDVIEDTDISFDETVTLFNVIGYLERPDCYVLSSAFVIAKGVAVLLVFLDPNFSLDFVSYGMERASCRMPKPLTSAL